MILQPFCILKPLSDTTNKHWKSLSKISSLSEEDNTFYNTTVQEIQLNLYDAASSNTSIIQTVRFLWTVRLLIKMNTKCRCELVLFVVKVGIITIIMSRPTFFSFVSKK